MPPVAIEAGIMAAGALAGGLLSSRASSKATKASERANREATALERQQLEKQTIAEQYAMKQDAATRARNMVLANALLRSYGASGLQDPSMDYMSMLNEPPPDLTMQRPMPGGAFAPRPGMPPGAAPQAAPRGATLRDVMALGPQGIAMADTAEVAGARLGDYFNSRRR